MKENNFEVNEHVLKTAISNVEPNKIVTREYNQEELISKIRYSDMVFLMLKGELPTTKQSKLFNHILVSFCDHGVTPPSTQTARLITSSGSPMNTAVAGALLSFGKNHAGAIEKAMKLYQFAINSLTLTGDVNLDNKQIASLAIDVFSDYSTKKIKIPGFGHRYHTEDPRARKIKEIAISQDLVGPHTKLALSIENLISERKGICLNIDGINAALLSDLGFFPQLGLGVFIIGRVPGIIAHINEESMDEEEFRRFCNLEDIIFEG
ncbi:MAG: citryl-CoA lyase [archaeon]|nr:citryl-CoA lyase [archaeon]